MNIAKTNLVILSVVCVTFAQNSGNKCGLEKFRCRNGECIASDLLCDGRPDCRDRSDETQAECSKAEIVCPEYAFRCNYGACIDGDKTCNGIKDCIDNSDETLARCAEISRNNSTSSTECSVNQFKCDSGQCVDGTALCDGAVDCTDGSDETFTKCSSFNCPQLIFRCTYGACIDGDLKCNGVINCADGSDEDPKLCAGLPNVTPTTEETRTTPTYTASVQPTTVSPPVWTPKQKMPCATPPQPNNGNWRLHKSQCPTGQHCEVAEGIQLEPGAYLVYTCNSGYKINGSKDVFCGPGGRWLNIPTCEAIRCKPLTSASTDALCTYNGRWTSCDVSVLPGTLAQLQCRNSYRTDATLLLQRRDNVKCNDKGQWEPDPIRCIPVCGVAAAHGKPLIVNGTQAMITEFPWHATLYRFNPVNKTKDFICGATVIQEKLLLTAAHCVYDENNKRIFDPSIFYIATGNVIQDYDFPLHDPVAVKKSRVKNIYMICNYLGEAGNYAWDIAILEVVKPFVFSSLLLPACLDTSSYSDETVLAPGSFGKVAGFGRTATGPSSAILQTVTLPYVRHDQCKSSAPLGAEKFITIDKFCAGYTNGSSVCDGDSGGGLVFKSGDLWYLRGIVSIGLGAELSGGTRICDSHSYSLYTRVSSHIGWIQDVMLKLEMYNSYTSCSNPYAFHK